MKQANKLGWIYSMKCFTTLKGNEASICVLIGKYYIQTCDYVYMKKQVAEEIVYDRLPFCENQVDR